MGLMEVTLHHFLILKKVVRVESQQFNTMCNQLKFPRFISNGKLLLDPSTFLSIVCTRPHHSALHLVWGATHYVSLGKV